MKDLAGKKVMKMKECIKFTGFSRSTINKLIALTKKNKLTPPFPFIDVFGSNIRHHYRFNKEAIINWIDARSIG
jgi:predicted DNA-binding transcriptional regulator AlpA